MGAATLLSSLLGAAVALSLAMAAAWLVAERTRRSSVIDATWSLAVGFVAVAAVALAPAETAPARRVLVALMAAAWSLRLGIHLVRRTLQGGDDPRYAQLRTEWGAEAPKRLFLFLQIQAAAGVPLVAAVLLAATRPGPFGPGDALGITLFALALCGEALADRQLREFRAAQHGPVCDTGLWAWSRHPNYFFEWLAWLGIAVMALSFAHPIGWLALLAPAMMYWLLVHVSGIPPLETHMLRSRGAAFAEYQRRVSAFWPMPPRNPPASMRRPAGGDEKSGGR